MTFKMSLDSILSKWKNCDHSGRRGLASLVMRAPAIVRASRMVFYPGGTSFLCFGVKVSPSRKWPLSLVRSGVEWCLGPLEESGCLRLNPGSAT